MVYRAVIPALLIAGALMGAAQDKPKSIKDVMAAHKKDALLDKIKTDKASDEEKKHLVELYEYLATQKPSMGDEASWKEKTGAMVSAAKEIAEKKAGAMDNLKKATNCKACHDVHKPKK
jgi:hypothetical protein